MLQAPTNEKKVFVVGDSISLHYGPYLEASLRGFMTYSRKEGEEEAMLNLDEPQGANGGDSSMVLEYLAQKMVGSSCLQDADFLLVNCGLHDIKTDPTTGDIQVPLEKYKENLKRIIELVGTLCTNTELVWIRSTPLEDEIHNAKQKKFHRHKQNLHLYNAAADDIMAEHGINSIDLFTFTNNLCHSEGNLFCDHVHFHKTVREKQGVFIAGWLIGKSAKV